MSLGILNSTVGYDVNGLQDIITDINANIIPQTCKSIINGKNNTITAIKSVWVGASANAFIEKLEADTQVLCNTLYELGDGIKNNINNAGSNVESYDEEIARQLFGISSSGTSSSPIVKSIGTPYSKAETTNENNVTVLDVINQSACTIGTGVLGLLEGVGTFIESIVDTSTIILSGAATIGTYTYDLVTGDNLTERMWDNTKAYVSYQGVKSVFDDFYNNSGAYLVENTLEFDTIRSISSGVGYTGSIVATGGLGAATYGLATGGLIGVGASSLSGLAIGTEEAWNSGASIVDGINYGLAEGSWNGIRTTIGTTIATAKPFTNSKINKAFEKTVDKIGQGIENTSQDSYAKQIT